MSKAVQKKAQSAPAMPQADEILGFEEGLSEDEIIIPRARLLQPTSELVGENGLAPGMIVNSVTGEQLGEVFTPILKKSSWIRFNARDPHDDNFVDTVKPGGIVWRSNDPNDPLVQDQGKFGPNGEPPIAIKFINIFSLFEGSAMPLVISFAKTSFKTGRELLTLARFSGEKQFFARSYILTTKKEQNDKGTYFVFKVRQKGKVSDDMFEQCMAVYKTLTEKKVQIHDEEKAVEEETPF